MNTDTSPQRPETAPVTASVTAPVPRRARSARRRPSVAVPLVLAAAGLAVTVAAGCGATGTSDASDAKSPESAGSSGSGSGRQSPKSTGKRVLWVGDSIAGTQAPPTAAALKASGVTFEDASSTGGGTIVEGDKMARQIAAGTWKSLAKHVKSFRPNVIAYQITTYDWGTPAQQRASYEKLAKTARDADADLFLVTAPPFKIDDFYAKYRGPIKSAPEAAERAARNSGGHVHFLDASKLWGTDASASKAQRAKDGIHSCQQGSATFAQWFTKRLGSTYDFTPAPPQKWANGPWTGDKAYAKLGCE
ncbi:SGNH/GDSL hydrolase family protein [Streptomyces albiaxialis]|uniref:SGNH/GDSL hydrolase family protein n=1 Tax=Streptomyces albiaxialis TaxID=329523 RepID=A0ABP5IQL2_9ACTN